jgi:hypothetical protein
VKGLISGLDNLGEVDLDHNRIHHEEQADGDRDRHYRRAADVERDTIERRSYTRSDLPE